MRPLHHLATAASLLVALTACGTESPSEPTGLDLETTAAEADGPITLDPALLVAPNFGAKASGSELATPGIVTDGGPGVASASISGSNFTASADFVSSSTFLPELKAFSRNTTADNSDDITQARAEAYQVFTSSAAQTITLDVSLSAIVVDNSTDVSFVLADVFVYGGPDFEVSDSPICPDDRLGRFMFDGTYFCGSRLGRSNLFIPVGDLTMPDAISFTVSAGATFGVFAVLRANSSGGSADASQTLTLDFTDDQFITAVDFSGPPSVSVDIDLKPGSDDNCVNLKSRGVVPVAILGSDAFDVSQIDLTSLAFAGLELRARGKKGPMCSQEDSNQDGLPDLVCHFQMDASRWTVEEGEATLSGVLLDGTAITGSDQVCLVP